MDLISSSQKVDLSFEEDDWLRERDQTKWHIKLSNGAWVIQDDERPNVDPHSAWLRLRKYCYDNDLYIDEFVLRFRSHIENIEKADGYFFSRGILASMTGEVQHQYVVGRVVEDKIFVNKWRVPELIVTESDERDIDKVDLECLIVKKSMYPHLVGLK